MRRPSGSAPTVARANAIPVSWSSSPVPLRRGGRRPGPGSVRRHARPMSHRRARVAVAAVERAARRRPRAASQRARQPRRARRASARRRGSGAFTRDRSPHCVLVLSWRRRAPFTDRCRRATRPQRRSALRPCAHDDLSDRHRCAPVRAGSVSRSQPWADTRNSCRTLRSVVAAWLALELRQREGLAQTGGALTARRPEAGTWADAGASQSSPPSGARSGGSSRPRTLSEAA